MCIMSNPVLILSGIVWSKEGSWNIGDTQIEQSLEVFVGKNVVISAHHWPDANNIVCYNPRFCLQHTTNKNFLFNFKKDLLFTGISQIPLEKLSGHNCRIIVLWKDFEIPKPDEEYLKQGSADLEKLLESLQKTLEELK